MVDVPDGLLSLPLSQRKTLFGVQRKDFYLIFANICDMAYSQSDNDLESDNCGDMSEIHTRLQSFHNFPTDNLVSPQRLARAGFFFTGNSDRVRCFSCNHTVENWSSGDAPVERHQQVSPCCTYLSCTQRVPSQPATLNGHAAPSTNSAAYDEEREDLEYRLRTGEVVDETDYPKHPDMCREEARLDTFQSWPPSAPVRPRELAQAGFYYTNSRDRVECFCCGGVLGNWEPGDEAWKEHERHFSNCFFILGHEVGNIPCQQPPDMDTVPYMGSYEERLRSFTGQQHPIDPERLARAGFYSTGELDKVMCFQCAGGLKGWQADEDPWEEHAKYYPGCNFLIAEKGQAFVNSIQLGNPGRNSAPERVPNGLAVRQEDSGIMQSSVVQRALEMGFNAAEVERTAWERVCKTGMEYDSVEALISDLTRAESESEEAQDKEEEDPMEKLRKLQQEKLCKVCMDKNIAIVFIPCGHLVTCKKCSEVLSKCPICCAPIIQKVKTYLS
ncbi:E3 ubiquitin-protein ligase XIAP-like [Huso huso]|uniref:E3 ubiquitin-protein ligase XIAP n=1 Tax=Huso huso TaxID=61971 RepID=A0ABR0YMD0_HUSHU